MAEKRKTVTSTEVKRRYNQKVYSQISFSAPKELVEEFRGMWIITRSSSLMCVRRRKAGSTLRKMPGFLLDIMVENNRNIVHNKSKYKKV